MKQLLNIGQKIENGLLVATFSVMVLTSFAQVVNRNIFKLPIPWFEEAATYAMIYMVLIGTEIGLRDGTQISVTTLVDKLKGRTRLLVQLLAKLAVEVFSMAIFAQSIKMLGMQIRTGQTSPALHLPMSVPYAALTISFGIIVLVQGAEFVTMAAGFKKIREVQE